jgi:hypothetical protein
MPGHEIDGRGLDGLAAFTAQAAKKTFEGHIASALHQQPHRIADRTASAMQAMQPRVRNVSVMASMTRRVCWLTVK